MPERSGLELLEDLRALDRDAVVIMITGLPEIDTAARAVRAGAYDYLRKPFSADTVTAAAARAIEHRKLLMERRRYREHLEREVQAQTRKIRSLYLESVHALNNALEAKDAYTQGHSLRVARYTDMITSALDLSVETRESIHLAARLHDIGKIGVRDEVLLKDRRLTPEEFAQIREHPAIGARILDPITDLAGAKAAVLHHHERWDGRGYPEGLAGENIPLGARALFIADAFDAMTTDRTYVKARSYAFAVEEIRRCAGTQFDPDLAAIFAKAAGPLITGAKTAASV
ncbi:MAG: HD domain-containing protein [Myxococcales bacterium]|nr:HD domain-containing protein [Myxococcales bacterium]